MITSVTLPSEIAVVYFLARCAGAVSLGIASSSSTLNCRKIHFNIHVYIRVLFMLVVFCTLHRAFRLCFVTTAIVCKPNEPQRGVGLRSLLLWNDSACPVSNADLCLASPPPEGQSIANIFLWLFTNTATVLAFMVPLTCMFRRTFTPTIGLEHTRSFSPRLHRVILLGQTSLSNEGKSRRVAPRVCPPDTCIPVCRDNCNPF